ncbi:MAG: hypothetical protein ACLTDR_03535 [Adlercreutzia equolifaciens]
MRVAVVSVAIVVVLLVGAAAGGFAWLHWFSEDDAADFAGTWYLAGTATPITITEDRIQLTDDVSYRYALNDQDKTFELSFGNLKGGGRYRFSLDRNQLALVDGDFSGADTLGDDIVWTLRALAEGAQGRVLAPGRRPGVSRCFPARPRGRRRFPRRLTRPRPRLAKMPRPTPVMARNPATTTAAQSPTRPMPRRPPTPRTKLTTVPRLAVERIAFERDRMALLVRVPEGADASLGTCGARSAAGRAALSRLPHLLERRGRPLRRGARPHLAAPCAGASRHRPAGREPACAADATFVGTTEWLSRRDGLARVTVNFIDDLIALGALKDALALLEGTGE